MELPKILSEKRIKYPALEGKEDLRFELFGWLQGKGLTVRQGLDLLNMTANEIADAHYKTADTIML